LRAGRGRRLRAPLVVAAVAAVGTVGVGAGTPSAWPLPGCVFRALTGLFCPGCGATRALHELTHLDVAAAWDLNPLFVLALPIALAVWARWVVRARRGLPRGRHGGVLGRATLGRVPRARAEGRRGAWATWVAVAALLVFAVLRNLPGSVLAPG